MINIVLLYYEHYTAVILEPGTILLMELGSIYLFFLRRKFKYAPGFLFALTAWPIRDNSVLEFKNAVIVSIHEKN